MRLSWLYAVLPAGIILQIRTKLIPSTSSSSHYYLIFLLLDATIVVAAFNIVVKKVKYILHYGL